jgi:hypothetical protein
MLVCRTGTVFSPMNLDLRIGARYEEVKYSKMLDM